MDATKDKRFLWKSFVLVATTLSHRKLSEDCNVTPIIKSIQKMKKDLISCLIEDHSCGSMYYKYVIWFIQNAVNRFLDRWEEEILLHDESELSVETISRFISDFELLRIDGSVLLEKMNQTFEFFTNKDDFLRFFPKTAIAMD